MVMVLRFIVSGWLFLGWIDPFADQVRQGNELYNNGNYDGALDKYLNAQVNSPDDPQLSFNVADTQYKRGKYDEALQAFEKTMKSGNLEMQAKSSFNIGNTLYKQGKMNEALDWYKRTVDVVDEIAPEKGSELDQLKNDAKYNYEFVEKKLEEKEQQQQQGEEKEQEKEQEQQQNEQEQQNNQDKDDDQSGENKEEEENKQQEPEEENKRSENKQKDDLNKEKEQQPHPNEDQMQNQPPPQQQDTQSQQERPHQMSKEEAERILDALNQSEKEARNINREKKRQPHRSVEKDW